MKWLPVIVCALSCLALTSSVSAEAPTTSYIFPAGGQRGTSVKVRVGGHYLHQQAKWEMAGPGVQAGACLIRTERIWFEGPLIKQPASQQSENYPQDYAGTVAVAGDAPPGPRPWRVWNAQGITAALPFVVGDLPEIVEQELDGRPIPVAVTLPVTINGRIFPREDVDVWTFAASAGQPITCKVAASELGSPLESQIEVYDPQGQLIAESDQEQLRFTARVSGRYELRIADSRFGGLQHYVYRLTITGGAWVDSVFPLGGKRNTEIAFQVVGQQLPGELLSKLPDVEPAVLLHSLIVDGKSCNPLLLDVDDVDEVLEPASGALPTLPVPGVANGRIARAGECDIWSFRAAKGSELVLEVRASRLNSPLDSILLIKDAAGKELARGDDSPDSPDARVSFTAPSDGLFTAEVSEKFASRGGHAFAYRLKATPVKPDFRLTVANDALNIDVETEKKVAISVERLHGFKGPIKVTLPSAAAGISAPEVVIAPNQNRVELPIQVAAESPVQLVRVKIVGQGEHDGTAIERLATFKNKPSDAAVDQLLIMATLPTPFRFYGEYQLRYVPRGGVLKKTFRIDRGNYVGPLEVALAERQGRHLQGVAGPTIMVPPDQNEFEYPVTLPPWMELGRTSRTNLMLTGEVADAAGIRHKVCYSTTEQNDQLIALVSPAPLRLSVDRSTIAATKNSEVVVPVTIHRDRSLTGPVTLELIVPPQVHDLSAKSETINSEQHRAEFRLRLGEAPGPFTKPLILRGISHLHGQPMVAEVALELILP